MSRVRYSRTLIICLLIVVLVVWFLWVNPFGWSNGKLNGEQLSSCGRPGSLSIETFYNSIDVEQVSSIKEVEAELVGDIGQSVEKIEVTSTGNAVKILVPKTGFFENGGFWGFNRRKLVIRIPSDLTLEELNVESKSGSIDLYGIKASEIVVEATSGSVSYEDLEAKNIDLASTSGSVKGGSAKASDNLKLHSASGSVKGEEILCSDLNASSTSGSVAFGSIEAEKAKLVSVSGSVKGEKVLVKSIVAQSTSGSVALSDLSFADSADLSSVSGSIKVNLDNGDDLKISGKSVTSSVNINGESYSKSFEKVYGDGSRKLELSSTSGSLNITW